MTHESKLEDNFNLKEFILYYLKYTKYFLISVLVSFTICFIFLRYVSPNYRITASILVKEDKDDFSNKLNDISKIGFDLSGNNLKIENEIQILKSRSIITSVVQNLNLNIEYYNLNSTKKDEYFDNLPANISFLNGIQSTYNVSKSIEIKNIGNSKVKITDLSTNKIYINSLGRSIKTSFGNIIITPNGRFNNTNFNLLVKINKIDNVVDNLMSSISVELIKKESSILSIKIDCKNIQKGKKIINELIKQHSNETINDKIEISLNTLNFIKNRIKFITSELSNIEGDASVFKSKNKIINFEKDAELFIEKESENQKLLSENQIQIELNEYILNHIKNNKVNDLLPFNIGISNKSVDDLISSINNLIIERNKLLVRSNTENPIAINLENQITSLKLNLKESLIGNKKSLKITKELLNLKQKKLDKKLNSAPEQEKDYREISRQQQIKESLYLFLLQKREETSLQLAVATSNTKLIDKAYCNSIPVSPNKKFYYFISIAIGLLIPFSIISLLKISNTKIKTISDIEDLNITVLGDLPLVRNLNSNYIINKGDRSSIAEAYRILRTNINFFLSNINSNSKTIFITSTFSSEGKSFVSINLAKTIAMTQKKVLLIGFDLRLPKITEYLNEKNHQGVTNFIINKELSFSELVYKSDKLEGVDIISSGIIPPNPAELILSERVNELFTEAKNKYDYIVVDTAPVGLVTDTFLIKDYADLTMYITRANLLEKKSLNILCDIYFNKRLNNVSVLVNGIDYSDNQAIRKGYGYGNYVNESKNDNFLKKILKKLSLISNRYK